ncbi:hypothetical protein ACFYTS_13410 [Nocardia sp. NPDC004151]|uniref:hypothetical protein n=1 Tax=Nocardia sp. NPDC004151 TaxID=3364304 RepID=UPI0036C30E86
MSAGCGCGDGAGQVTRRGMCKLHYDRLRTRQIAYGRWNPRVPGDAVRAHIETLGAAGVRPGQVAHLAGLGHSTISRILANPGGRVSDRIQAAILKVAVPEHAGDVTADNALVPILGARRRVQALVAAGHPASRIAREIGVAPNSATMAALVGKRTDGQTSGRSITAERERAVRAVFDRWQWVPGQSARARAIGARNGWPLPLEWDETAIDDPHSRPEKARWTPASAREERRDHVDRLTSQGLTAPEIAERLGINIRLVERDRAHHRGSTDTESTAPEPTSRDEVQAMGEVAAKARVDIAARRQPARRRGGLERTR